VVEVEVRGSIRAEPSITGRMSISPTFMTPPVDPAPDRLSARP